MRVRLDELMVMRGLAPSRTAAQRLVREGKVRVGGKNNPTPGNPVAQDAEIEVAEAERFVGRGALKLEGAMERFGLDESVLVRHSQSDLVNVGGRTIRVVPAHEYLMS